MNDLLSEVVTPLLGTAWLGRAWRFVPECGSTNDEAAAWARQGAPHGAVVVADTQTRGRGRLGRVWHSPRGTSLYFSAVLRPPLEPSRVPPITLAAGVAVAEAVARFHVAPALKWPNDVLVDGKKLAGILTESSASSMRVEHVIVGIGVNLNVESFPADLNAISLACDRALFAAALCERLEHWHDRFVQDGPAQVVEAWRGFARFFGTRIRVAAANGTLEGIAEDLDEDGALRLRDGDAIHRVVAGEMLY
jgi:BirA family biotin operon repressor/biotin-[acetyl-CoA-carboxylase] ligase